MIRGALAASLAGALALVSGCVSTATHPPKSAYYEDAGDACDGDITVAQRPWVLSDSDCRKAR